MLFIYNYIECTCKTLLFPLITCANNIIYACLFCKVLCALFSMGIYYIKLFISFPLNKGFIFIMMKQQIYCYKHTLSALQSIQSMYVLKSKSLLLSDNAI